MKMSIVTISILLNVVAFTYKYIKNCLHYTVVSLNLFYDYCILAGKLPLTHSLFTDVANHDTSLLRMFSSNTHLSLFVQTKHCT